MGLLVPVPTLMSQAHNPQKWCCLRALCAWHPRVQVSGKPRCRCCRCLVALCSHVLPLCPELPMTFYVFLAATAALIGGFLYRRRRTPNPWLLDGPSALMYQGGFLPQCKVPNCSINCCLYFDKLPDLARLKALVQETIVDKYFEFRAVPERTAQGFAWTEVATNLDERFFLSEVARPTPCSGLCFGRPTCLWCGLCAGGWGMRAWGLITRSSPISHYTPRATR